MRTTCCGSWSWRVARGFGALEQGGVVVLEQVGDGACICVPPSHMPSVAKMFDVIVGATTTLFVDLAR